MFLMERLKAFLGFNADDIRLIGNLFRMNLKDRYIGSMLGVCWAVINPLFQLAVYTFIFAFVLKAKIPGSDSTFQYVIWLITGLVPWIFFSDSLSVSSASVVNGSTLVKNIVFKSECLPVAAVLLGLIPFLAGIVFAQALLIADGNMPSVHLLALPVVILLQLTLLIGLSWLLSALTVFIRDMTPMLTSLLLILMFATPIFYSIEMMPGWAQTITFFNPFYQIIQAYRDILLVHRWPDAIGLIYVVSFVLFLDILGLKFFRVCKDFFEAVL